MTLFQVLEFQRLSYPLPNVRQCSTVGGLIHDTYRGLHINGEIFSFQSHTFPYRIQ